MATRTRSSDGAGASVTTTPFASVEQPRPQVLRLPRGDVGEAGVAAGVAAHAQPQLGEAEEPAEAGLDHVDRLHLRPAGSAASCAGSAPSRSAAPGSSTCQRVTSHETNPSTTTRPRIARFDDRAEEVAAADERRHEHDRERDRRAPGADERRQRMQAVPDARLEPFDRGSAASVTTRPPAPRRASRAGRGASRPRPPRGPGCARRSPPRPCAGAASRGRTAARPGPPRRR